MANWWDGFHLREIQTNMREIDMMDMDAEEYVRQLKDFEANAVMINTAGILASYETDLPYHFQSPFLKGDSIEKMIEACHKNGIKCIARTDFSKIRRSVYEQNPDWAYRTSKGEIVDYNGDVHACICGNFQQNYAFKIIREVCGKFEFDGLFINMGGFQVRDYSYNFHGICHCKNCQQKFKEQFGMELPVKMDMEDRTYRAYRVFQRNVMDDYHKRLTELIRSINPNIMIHGIDYFRCESNTEYRRPLPYWQYSASSNTRGMRGVDVDHPVVNTSVDFVGFYYRHISVSPEQQQLRLWQDTANIGGIDYYLIGRLDNKLDKSAYELVKEVFRFHKKYEDTYLNLRSVADALVVRTHHWHMNPEEMGWIRALTESHILFDEADVENALAHDLSKYKTIIVGGVEVIPEEFAQKLDEFAQNGGTVICSGNTAAYDGMFQPYDNCPIKCLGVTSNRYRRDDMVSAMLYGSKGESAVFPYLLNSEIIFFGDQYWYNEYADGAKKYLKMIAPQMFGPPERCYHTLKTEDPGVVVHHYGKGKGIIVPWCVGDLYFREGYSNTFLFMSDLLKNIAGLQSVAPDLSGMVEVTYSKEADQKFALVQLVNGTGHFGTSYMKPVPVRSIGVCIPCQKTVKKAVSLMNETEIPFEQENGKVSLVIDELKAFESVKLIF